MLEQACDDILEVAFKDFPLSHTFFDKIEHGKTGSISKLWQEFLTEFPIDKKRSTFEFLARAVYSAQTMSVNTANEYTTFLSTVHDVVETLGSKTFTTKEVMFLLEMTLSLMCFYY